MNNASNSSLIKIDFISELIKSSQSNISDIIYYLFDSWHILILNLSKYLDVLINLRFSLSIKGDKLYYFFCGILFYS